MSVKLSTHGALSSVTRRRLSSAMLRLFSACALSVTSVVGAAFTVASTSAIAWPILFPTSVALSPASLALSRTRPMMSLTGSNSFSSAGNFSCDKVNCGQATYS